MTYRGKIKDGSHFDHTRDNWNELERMVNQKLFKGTLNIILDEKISLDDVDYDFEIWNTFRVKRGKIKTKNKVKEVYVGYQFGLHLFTTFFIFSNVKLRDEYNLSNGDTVEVII